MQMSSGAAVCEVTASAVIGATNIPATNDMTCGTKTRVPSCPVSLSRRNEPVAHFVLDPRQIALPS